MKTHPFWKKRYTPIRAVVGDPPIFDYFYPGGSAPCATVSRAGDRWTYRAPDFGVSIARTVHPNTVEQAKEEAAAIVRPIMRARMKRHG